MGRADRFVESEPDFAVLVRRLLGRTWLVDRLVTALKLAQSAGRGLDFVTSDGELFTADGTLIVGPRRGVTGVLSRRSELRACHQQVAALEDQLAQQESLGTRLDQDRLNFEATVSATSAALSELSAELALHRQRSVVAQDQLDRCAADERQLEAELDRNRRLGEETSAALQANEEERAAAIESIRVLQADIEQRRKELAICQQRRTEAHAAGTNSHLTVAKCEERVEMLRHQLEQAKRNLLERSRVEASTRSNLAAREEQLAALDAAIRSGSQALADLLLQKERDAEELAANAARLNALRQDRISASAELDARRQALAAIQSQQHQLEVAVARVRHERQTLCERMLEDYGIDLAEAAKDRTPRGTGSDEENPTTDPPSASVATLPNSFDRLAVEREIADLREQIGSMGGVNLDALDEIETLEARFNKLSQQYSDLVEAKAALEKIITRINTDSRQLFLGTLETIRGHFQELFRRLFGGGEADIVIDEAEDALECGIEIIARPPGKEACIISLLSGGEKTLTCVALLLAVFRSKPSPFCVLDEVDAALDEANIGRFIDVLREFLSFTQFIVVTHSKKTMAGGDTLYGVTMEESGVSKRVAVRFEDVSDDGQILPSALVANHRQEPAAVHTDVDRRRAA
jgi:chromosome segregation protein